jgi:hypothetical protein
MLDATGAIPSRFFCGAPHSGTAPMARALRRLMRAELEAQAAASIYFLIFRNLA